MGKNLLIYREDFDDCAEYANFPSLTVAVAKCRYTAIYRHVDVAINMPVIYLTYINDL